LQGQGGVLGKRETDKEQSWKGCPRGYSGLGLSTEAKQRQTSNAPVENRGDRHSEVDCMDEDHAMRLSGTSARVYAKGSSWPEPSEEGKGKEESTSKAGIHSLPLS
jgi:hypothetical protein